MPTSSQQSTAPPNSPLAGTFKQLRLDRDLHSRTVRVEEKLEDVTMSDGDDVRGRQEGETEREKQKQPGRGSRPTLGRRTTSYSKRHSSLDTPREVPAPFRFFDDRPTSTTSSHAHHQPTHSAPSNAPPGQHQLQSDVPLHEDDQPPAYDSAPTQLPSPPLL
ncbi:uncharacterized protein STEHIDRAFT_124118, partial [Stereum hirsutum FP-91666 SS1]|uniref:uncharacterized protein n=1 Tax=Stereum hirsutum (strain FP-91666) TaxID=721885 RepID=UPI000444A6E3